VWDLTGRPLGTFGEEYGEARAVGVSPDSKRAVAYAGTGGKFFLTVWDLPTRKEFCTLEGPAPEGPDVVDAVFSADGKRILAANQKNEIFLWDIATRRELSRFHRKGPPVQAVALSPDGCRALTVSHFSRASLEGSSSGGEILLWNLPKGRVCQVWEKTRGAETVAFSPDGRRALTGGWGDIPLVLWEVMTGRPVWRVRGGAGETTALQFSTDGKQAFRRGGRKWLVHDLATGRMQRALDGSEATDLEITPDGRWGVGGNTLAFYDLQCQGRLRWLTLVDPPARKHVDLSYGEHTRAAVSANGKYVLSAGQVGGSGLLLWDAKAGKPLRRFFGKGVRGDVGILRFSPDGKRALSAGTGSVLKCWDVASGREIASFNTKGVVTLEQKMGNLHHGVRRAARPKTCQDPINIPIGS
jgi:WD40 repeat protein